jgi:hypothetical protein
MVSAILILAFLMSIVLSVVEKYQISGNDEFFTEQTKISQENKNKE